jgi:hypothetical protein
MACCLRAVATSIRRTTDDAAPPHTLDPMRTARQL